MHLDFVIFNRFDNAPLLAIEVDGIAHHEQNEKQKEKDSIKSEAIFLVGCFFLDCPNYGVQFTGTDGLMRSFWEARIEFVRKGRPSYFG